MCWRKFLLGMQSQEITCIAWATSHRTLAAGTRKGSLVLFWMDQERRAAFTGKHGRAITGAAWSNSGLLALAGRDNQASLLPLLGGCFQFAIEGFDVIPAMWEMIEHLISHRWLE